MKLLSFNIIDWNMVVVNITIEFMFAGINMFWVRLRLILARAVRRGLKWALRRAQNIFMPKNINSITNVITLEGIEETNTEKMTTKQVWIIFFSPALGENVNKLWNGFSILIGCLDRTIIWFSVIIGLFQRPKIYYAKFSIWALKMRHDARQGDNLYYLHCWSRRYDHQYRHWFHQYYRRGCYIITSLFSLLLSLSSTLFHWFHCCYRFKRHHNPDCFYCYYCRCRRHHHSCWRFKNVVVIVIYISFVFPVFIVIIVIIIITGTVFIVFIAIIIVTAFIAIVIVIVIIIGIVFLLLWLPSSVVFFILSYL